MDEISNSVFLYIFFLYYRFELSFFFSDESSMIKLNKYILYQVNQITNISRFRNFFDVPIYGHPEIVIEMGNAWG